MLPSRLEAEKELEIAGQLNPGPWVEHSLNTGRAAQCIAGKCEGLDPEKAYVLGILHDIGRRVGIVTIEHVYEGYQYASSKGWDEVARICMTHSYPIKNKDFDDQVVGEEEIFIKSYINECIYDDYDKLIQLCDSLAVPHGFCLLEKRFVDVVRRYGFWNTTIDRWNRTFEIKEYFEKKIGCSIYDILTDVKETTFIDGPVWKIGNK